MSLDSFVPALQQKMETLRDSGEVFIGNDDLARWMLKPVQQKTLFNKKVFTAIRRHWRVLHRNVNVPMVYIGDFVDADGGVRLVQATKPRHADWFTLDQYSEETTGDLKKRRKYPLALD